MHIHLISLLLDPLINYVMNTIFYLPFKSVNTNTNNNANQLRYDLTNGKPFTGIQKMRNFKNE